jgi:hypothetical protein
MALLTFLVMLLGISSAASIITQARHYPAYRRTYRALLSGRLQVDRSVSDQTMVFISPDGKSRGAADPGRVLYFPGSREFMLLGRTDLHRFGGRRGDNYPLTYLDPYSLYWQIRLRRLAERLAAGEDPRQIRRQDRISRIIG